MLASRISSRALATAWRRIPDKGCTLQTQFLRNSVPSRCVAAKTTDNQKSSGDDAASEAWARNIGLIAVAAAGIGGIAWAVTPFFWSTPHSEEAPTKSSLLPISDEIFDNEDNLFVFFLDIDEAVERRAEIEKVIETLAAEEGLHRVRYFFNVRKEGDPPVPEAEQGQQENSKKPLRVVMYKGQRKTVVNIGDEIPLQKIKEFYDFLSQEISSNMNKKYVIPYVSSNSFSDDVLQQSTPEHPILVQLFEDTCFLCFLMRPFVNSIQVLLAEHGVPLSIKRLNVEKNDFPDGCPVARGTPTFVLFQGAGIPPMKWDEFKPKDLVEKLTKELPKIDEALYTKLENYQNLVSRRFQLFTQLVYWTVELQKLQALVATPTKVETLHGDDDQDFNTTVAQMMSQDMKQVDGIHDNLKHLQHEVDEIEHDAVLMGSALAESIIERERQQAQEKA